MADAGLPSFHGIIGRSAAMRALFLRIERFAPVRCTGSDTGGVGHREGAGGHRGPPPECPEPRSLAGGELRRAHARPAAQRAVRARAGRVHGRDGGRHGLLAAPRRDGVPRRDRRHAAQAQATLLRVIQTARSSRRQRQDAADRRAVHRGHAPRSGGEIAGGAVPAGPLLPPERLTLHVPPLRERRARSCRWSVVLAQFSRELGADRPVPDISRPGGAAARGTPRGAATCASWRTCWSRR